VQLLVLGSVAKNQALYKLSLLPQRHKSTKIHKILFCIFPVPLKRFYNRTLIFNEEELMI